MYPLGYDGKRFRIEATDVFTEWLANLRDAKAKAVGHRVRELRVHVGPGYRIYFVRTGPRVLVLLSGGDKSTQRRDIERATRLLEQYGG